MPAKAKKYKLVEKDKKDPTLEMVMSKFKSARDYTRQNYWDTWDDAWKLYNNQRTDIQYEGNSDGFVPETFTIVQSVKANIISGTPRFEFYPTSPDQTGDIKVLNKMMEFVWVQDKTARKVDSAIDDMLVAGNGFLFQFLGKDGLPVNKYVPTKDVFVDPEATCYDDCRYVGYRYLTTLKELRGETVTNPEYEPGTETGSPREPRYKNLDDIEPGFKDENDKTAKQQKENDMYEGTTLGNKAGNDIVECIVYIDHEKMVTVANRATVIEDVETPFKRPAKTINSVDDMGNPVPVEIPEIEPFLPFAPFRDYVDGALFYARGEIEIIKELQERLNDTQNQKSDNLAYILNRMWALDPAYAHKIDEIQNVPGAVFTIPPGALDAIDTQPIGSDADNEMARIQDQMRRATAADELVQGAGQSEGGALTATEVRAQINQAGTRFQVKLEHLQNEGFEIMANNLFKLLQIFVTREMAIRMVGKDGVEWKSYNPGEFLGGYDIKVVLATNARAMKEEEKQNAMQFFLLASKMPFVDQMKLFEETAIKLFDKDPDEIDQLLQPIIPQVGLPTEQGAAPSEQGGLPQATSPDITNSLGQGAAPSVPDINAVGVPQA